jgi:MFS family permease
MTDPADADATAEAAPEATAPVRLSRNVKILGAVSLAQDTGSEMLYPLLPTFITGMLGAPVVAVGVAEGLADAAAAAMKLLAGRLAGAHHRRRWIAAGYGLATIGKIIVAAAFIWPVVIAGRVVDRLGKGIRGVPRDALIADDTPAGARGRAFGFHRSLDTLGAVIGPLIGLALLELLGGRIRPALVIAVIPAAASVALVALVREDGQPAPSSTSDLREPTPDPDPDRRLPTGFWRILAPLTVFALVNSTDALLLQRAAELGLELTEIVLVYVLYNIVYAALGYPAGRLADRIPARIVYAAGLVVFAAVYIGLGTTTSPTAVWMLLPCYGAYTALTDGVSRAWIADLATPDQRTWALGVHGATTGAGVLVAGLWTGLAWHGAGRIPLTIAGFVALSVATWLLIGLRPPPPPRRSPAPPR